MAIIVIQGVDEKRRGIHYEVDSSLAPIGAGGMGQVFRGVLVDERTGVRRDAAIKFLFDDLPESAIERSRREASVRISNENLVEMFGFIETESTDASGTVHRRYHVASELLYGVMLHDLIHGRTTGPDGQSIPFAEELLRQYKDERTRFSAFIIRNLLSGIMALHDAGYIHRDIDPSNIMITANGKVKLIDFGICRKFDSTEPETRHLTTAGQFMGKAAYAAPELATGDIAHQNETTDLYAIGIMFYELLTGKVPFEGATHEVLARQVKEPVPIKNISDKFARKIIKKATEKKQSDRYASAAEFRVAVEQLTRNSVQGQRSPVVDSVHTTNPGSTITEGIGIIKKKFPVMPIAIAISSLVAIAVIALLITRKSGPSEEEILAEKHNQEMIEQRRAELAGTILDSMDPQPQTDSITGMTVPTAAGLTREAIAELSSEADAEKAIGKLRRIAELKFASSAEAIAMLASISGRSATLDSIIKVTTDSLIPQDYTMAHTLNEEAIGLDPTNYRALYELGCDYLAGDLRGAVPRDLDKAMEYFSRGVESARKAGDERFVKFYEHRIDALNSASNN